MVSRSVEISFEMLTQSFKASYIGLFLANVSLPSIQYCSTIRSPTLFLSMMLLLR